MNPIPDLGRLLGLDWLTTLTDEASWWEQQDAITEALADRLRTEDTEHWLKILDAADLWCAPVLTLEELLEHPGFAAVRMTQQVARGETRLTTTRSPIRIDGERLTSDRSAPRLGEHNAMIDNELLGRDPDR
jgi:crotonobetainyl-CoA:carnitine CoA-transferase CaiB-like acyl-CoA transferase